MTHYAAANEHLKRQAGQAALQEFRRAAAWWRQAGTYRHRHAHRLAIVGVLASVLAVYLVLTLAFPRPAQPLVFGLSGGQAAADSSWWENLLNNGRPRPQQGPRTDMSRWWNQLKRRLAKGGSQTEDAAKGQTLTRRSLDKRWENLLRRYGRWGPLQTNTPLIDHHVIAGSGLSRNAGEYDEAVRVIEEGLVRTRDAGNLAELYHTLANVHYDRGYQLQPDGLATYQVVYMHKAASAYQEVIRQVHSPYALGNLGWVNYVLGNYAEAEFYSRQAVGLDSRLYYVHLNLALTLLAQGNQQQAYARYLWVTKQFPGDEVLRGGMKDLQEMLRDHPSRWPLARLMLGLLAVEAGNFTLAKDSIQAAQRDAALGPQWQEIAQHLLENMETRGLN